MLVGSTKSPGAHIDTSTIVMPETAKPLSGIQLPFEASGSRIARFALSGMTNLAACRRVSSKDCIFTFARCGTGDYKDNRIVQAMTGYSVVYPNCLMVDSSIGMMGCTAS
jgi:hypothetical protein